MSFHYTLLLTTNFFAMNPKECGKILQNLMIVVSSEFINFFITELQSLLHQQPGLVAAAVS